MGTMTDYNPRQHAQEVAQGNELALRVLRELAELRGDVALLVRALPDARATSAGAAAFDDLVSAIYGAMASSTWTCSDLLTRTIDRDTPACELIEAMAATSCRTNPKSLGRYLATNVPGGARVTAGGLEIRRSGMTDNTLAWCVAEV